MNKFDDVVRNAISGTRVDESTLTPGMLKALGKTMRLKRICDKCGFMMPKYSGRYPKFCPQCADPVTDKDKEVVVDEVEYGIEAEHTHAQQHKGTAANQMHLRGPLSEGYIEIQVDDPKSTVKSLKDVGVKAKLTTDNDVQFSKKDREKVIDWVIKSNDGNMSRDQVEDSHPELFSEGTSPEDALNDWKPFEKILSKVNPKKFVKPVLTDAFDIDPRFRPYASVTPNTQQRIQNDFSKSKGGKKLWKSINFTDVPELREFMTTSAPYAFKNIAQSRGLAGSRRGSSSNNVNLQVDHFGGKNFIVSFSVDTSSWIFASNKKMADEIVQFVADNAETNNYSRA